MTNYLSTAMPVNTDLKSIFYKKKKIIIKEEFDTVVFRLKKRCRLLLDADLLGSESIIRAT